MNLYFVKGYGYHENDDKNKFSVIIEVENKSKREILLAIEKESGLSAYRPNRRIVIEEIVVL